MKISKIIKKIVLWTLLACVAAFLAVWIGALAKNYILTVKYADVLENMEFYEGEFVNEYDYERILSYSENEIVTYFVKKIPAMESGGIYMESFKNGGIATYRRNPQTNKWSFGEHVLWSGRGSADEYIWPYWYHYIFK